MVEAVSDRKNSEAVDAPRLRWEKLTWTPLVTPEANESKVGDPEGPHSWLDSAHRLLRLLEGSGITCKGPDDE